MSSGWNSLPLLPLGYILEHLSLEDALAATAVSRHWRAGLLMYEGRRNALTLHVKEFEKSAFLARMFKKNARVLHVYIGNSSDEEISIFMNRVMPQFFDTLELEELIFMGPGCGQPAAHVKIDRMITESLVSKHSQCIQKFALMNCELDTVHTVQKDKEIPDSVEFYSRRLRFDAPSAADAVLSRHNAEAMVFSSLKHIIVDYDQITTETLETLSHLSSLTQLSAMLCNNELAIQTVDWRRAMARYRNGLSVALNLIYMPAKKIDEVMENVLVEDMPLTSLKVMFCKNLHTGLVKHVVRVHKASLRELVWADAPLEPAARAARAAPQPQYDARNVNPLILLCWQCTRLRRLVVHGYWVWQYDVVGFVRLRKSLEQLELSAVCARPGPAPAPRGSLARVRAADAAADTEVNSFAEFAWKPTAWSRLHPALRARASPAQRAQYVALEARRPLAPVR